MRRFHPDGFRAMARACFVDVRDAFDDVRIPTLVVHGERDTRTPRAADASAVVAVGGSNGCSAAVRLAIAELGRAPRDVLLR